MAFKIGSNTVIDSDGLSFPNFNKLSSTIASTEIEFTGSDIASGDNFGDYHSLGVGCNRIVVGAPGDGINQGAAYIYRLEDTITEITKKGGPGSNANFGFACAIGSGRIVVAAYGYNNGGTAYIYSLDGDLINTIQSSDIDLSDTFGYDVAVDCGKIVVTAIAEDTPSSNIGSAYIFNLAGVQEKIIRAPSQLASEDRFGSRVAIGNGRIAIASEFFKWNSNDDDERKGTVFIYDLKGQYLTQILASDGGANDYFGNAVDIGCGKIVVGAGGFVPPSGPAGKVYVYDLHGNEEFSLTTPAGLSAYDGSYNYNFGGAVSIKNNRIVVGAANIDNSGSTPKGKIFVYDLKGNLLEQFSRSGAQFGDLLGENVGISNGRVIAVTSGLQKGYAYNLNEGQDTYWENMLEGFADSDQI